MDIKGIEFADGLTQVNFEIDGQLMSLSKGNNTPISVQWPSQRLASQVKITTQPAVGAGLAAEGPWALFRLFDRFEVQPTQQPERFIVLINVDVKRARLEVTASSVFNPFRLREMQQFRCPGAF